MIRQMLMLALSIASCGCASHKQFYTSLVTPEDEALLVRYDGEPTLVYEDGDPNVILRKYFENGYGPLGYSSYVGANSDEHNALKLARELGAEYVVMQVEHYRTVSGAVPMYAPRSSTTNSTVTGTVYGPSGTTTGTAYGSSTTTTSEMTYIPYTRDEYEVVAVYFAPLAEHCLGVLLSDASNEIKSFVGRNKVTTVEAVRKGSAAYTYNLLAGDHLIDFDVDDIDTLKPNNEIVFSVVRNGEQVEVPLTTSQACIG